MALGDDKLKQKINEALKAARNVEGARNILASLFPKAEKVLQTWVPNEGGDWRERLRERRISTREYAIDYFQLNAQRVTWRKSEVQDFLSLSPLNALDQVEERVERSPEIDRGRLRRLFLEALDGAFGEDLPFSFEWFLSLMNVSAKYVHSIVPTDIFDDTYSRFFRVLQSAFEPLSEDEKFELIKNALPHISDISVLIDFFRTTVGDIHPDGSDRVDRRFFGSKTDDIRDLLLTKVRSLAISNELWNQADPKRILWFWWGCDKEDEVKEYTNKVLDNIEGVRRLLKIAISKVRSSEGDYDQVSKELSKIVPVERLAMKASELVSDAQSPSDTALAVKFLEALRVGQTRRA